MGKSLPSRVGGPLSPFARGFLVELRERGYEWSAVHARMRVMAELSDWIVVRGIDPRQLTQTLIAEFLEGVRVSQRGKPWCSPTSERQLVAYLRDVGLVSAREPARLTDPVELLVAEFVEYLVRERGLRDGSEGGSTRVSSQTLGRLRIRSTAGFARMLDGCAPKTSTGDVTILPRMLAALTV